MLNKNMNDLTVKDSLILTGVVTGLTLVPMAAIGLYCWWHERKEAKKVKSNETEE